MVPYRGDAHPQPDQRPRTPYGRLTANYTERLTGARQGLAEAKDKYATSHMTPAMARVDEAYVSGAYVRGLDPEIRRLRAAARRVARSSDDPELEQHHR